MITETQNRFMSSSLEETFKDFPLYSQDNRKRNAICLMLFTLGNIRWYILEGEKTNNDFTLYGIVVGLCSVKVAFRKKFIIKLNHFTC